MKAILYIFVFFILCNTLATSVMNNILDGDELTEISLEEEGDSEEENSDVKKLLATDMIITESAPNYLIEYNRVFFDKISWYSYIYSQNLFSPPKF